MNISAINSYNYTSFGKRGKYSKETTKPIANQTAKKATAIGLAGLVTIGAGGFAIRGCQNNNTTVIPTETKPAYVETQNTTPTEEATPEPTRKTYTYYAPVYTTKPESQRTPEYHTVKRGDRLADIVKHYAGLDMDTPDENLVPYYELLEADNPGKWKNRDVIYLDLKIRVDSILPENITITYPNEIENLPVSQPEKDIIEETEAIEETEPIQITSADDTVIINGIPFSFDLGTMDKTFGGDYNGLVFGKYVTLDKKIGGTLQETRYEGSSADSNKAITLTYDKDGKVIEKEIFKNNKPVETISYSYKTSTILETSKDNTAKIGQLDSIITVYDNGDNFVISKEFYNSNKLAANFNFELDTVQIGENSWTLDEGTFIFNEKAIGSTRYYGTINGQTIRFDVLKNGFCVEYLNKRGEIVSREQFDAKGNLIYTE